MLSREPGGPQLFDVEGYVYALRDETQVDGVARWRGVRIIRVPSDGISLAYTRMRFCSVFVAADGSVKGFAESDRPPAFTADEPTMLEPERTWLDRQRDAYEAEDSHRAK